MHCCCYTLDDHLWSLVETQRLNVTEFQTSSGNWEFLRNSRCAYVSITKLASVLKSLLLLSLVTIMKWRPDVICPNGYGSMRHSKDEQIVCGLPELFAQKALWLMRRDSGRDMSARGIIKYWQLEKEVSHHLRSDQMTDERISILLFFFPLIWLLNNTDIVTYSGIQLLPM